MASFTDLIPQFNPYIQQLPVEAMISVGMQKQKLYEEGVQKIQTQIDSIAGLDIIKDVDRQYLQSKLDELGNNLRTVAAGDFSNYQLVNSVGGMVKQVGRDESIQNAVSSTSWYRKQAALMEDAVKNGKSSQSNIFDFNEQANAWLNSNQVGEVFRGRYTPYKDTRKVAMEAIKALHPKLKEYDIPFEIKDGKINTKKIADAMERYKIEGIDEEQIQQAINASFSPEDWNQIRLDAKYHFRDVNGDQLVKRAEVQYAGKKTRYQSELDLAKEKKGITSDPTQLAILDKKIEFYETQLGKDGKPGLLDDELADNLELARTNPNQVKYSIYKDGYISEFANAFSWTQQSRQYVDNPIRKQMNWTEDMRLKWATENRQTREFAETMKRRDIEIGLKSEELALKRAELGLDPLDERVTVGNPTDIRDNSDGIVLGFTNEITESINTAKAKLKQRGLTDAQVEEMIADYQKNGNRATKAPSWAIGLLQNILRESNTLGAIQDKEKEIRKEAYDATIKDPRLKALAGQKERELAALNNGRPIAFTQYAGVDPRTRQSKFIRFSRTPQQLISDIENGRASLSVDKAPGGDIRVTFNSVPEAGNAPVTIQLKKNAPGADVLGGNEMRGSLKQVSDYYNKFRSFTNDFNTVYTNNYKDRLSPLANELVPTRIAVKTGNKPELPPRIIGNLSTFISANAEKNIAADDRYSTEKAASLLSEKNNKDTRALVEQDGDKFTVVLWNVNDPGNPQKLRMSGGDVARLIGSNYIDPLTRDAKIIRFAGGSGTNITGNPDRATMQQAFGDFPGINKFEVKADLVADGENPDLFYPKFYARRKDGSWQPFEVSGKNRLQRMGYEQARKQLNTLTDESFIATLKEEYPRFDFSILDFD